MAACRCFAPLQGWFSLINNWLDEVRLNYCHRGSGQQLCSSLYSISAVPEALALQSTLLFELERFLSAFDISLSN